MKLSANPNAYEIVKAYLKENGFDGLRNDVDGCACSLDDLAHCGEMRQDCTAGYLVKAPSCCDYDYYVCDSKDDKPWEW